MELFRGAGVALITPFHEDKSVNYEMLEKLVERQIENGTDAIIVCGTTGEPATMSEEERLAVISCVMKCANHRIPVIAGTGSNSTEGTVNFTRKVSALDVDGLLVVTPYYNKATQKGMYEHYKSVAAQTELPIILYNVPSRTGCNLLPQTVAHIAEDCTNVVGIKEASGNLSQIAHLARLTQDRLAIYSGNDDLILPVLSLGGIGVISVLSNVLPKETHDMVLNFLNGDLIKARKLQLDSLELVDSLFTEVNPIPVKAAMKLLGYEVGGLRLPLTEMEEKHHRELEHVMRSMRLI